MDECNIKYRAVCIRMMRGIQEACRILEETEKDCQKMFDRAVYEQIGEEDTGDLRHDLLQKAAEEKRHLFE